MGNLKSGVGRMVHAVYRHMPVGWAWRLTVKDWLFRTFPGAFASTQAYRRWAYFTGRVVDAVPAEALSPSARARGSEDGAREAGRETARPVDAYVSDLFAMSRPGQQECHVALREAPPPNALKAKAIAFYLPQFHPVPENDTWWGRGFTEWTNVSKALPQFVGHDQPHLPGELGFYDLRIVDNMRRQAELAKLYGIHGFCFHHYWFSGRRLLERPLDQLIANPDIDLPFCVCWANENWTRRWDGHDEDVLLGQSYTREDDLSFIVDLMPYLRDERYIRIDGRPVIVVYRPSLLPDCRRTLGVWREYCIEQGLGDPFLVMVQFDVEDPRELGFDAAVEFPPHKLARDLRCINDRVQIVNPAYAGYIVEYDELARSGENWPTPPYPLFKGVSPRWDNEARKPGKGYTFAGSTPERYHRWISSAVDYARRNPVGGENIVFLNAWNEWAEGAHLEPDRKYGYAYLDATVRAVSAEQEQQRLLVVSHDAHPHGAQYLALNLVKELKSGVGLDVEVLLMGDGPLEKDFRAVAPVHRLQDMDAAAVESLLRSLRSRGFDAVLANTAVAGRKVRQFSDAGFRIVTLVHELPGVLKQYHLEQAVADVCRLSDHVVVGSEAVREGLAAFVPRPQAERTIVRPQGLFTRSRYRGVRDRRIPRERLRAKLGIPPEGRVVLAVGYADFRKGVDLFAKVAASACKQVEGLHFVWVGHRDTSMQAEVEAVVRAAGIAAHVHFTGLDFDTDDYYAGADAYALTSREDPFPSVVLESLSVGTPVVAFSGTGGGADFVQRHDSGITVPALDTDAFSDAVVDLLRDEQLRVRLGQNGRQCIDAEFSFRQYAMDLCRLAGIRLPTVSVVVPNYNYAHLIEARLRSISGQTLPLYEIIVLDDCSTDDSLLHIERFGGQIVPEPRIVGNTLNSGSVFRQWKRGVELARGEYVWIAEADDLSKPEFVERMVGLLHQHPDAVFAYCQSEQIDAEGKVLASDYLEYTRDLSETRWLSRYVAEGQQEVDAGLSVKNTIPNVSAVLFRRKPLVDVLQTHLEEICRYRIAGDWIAYLHLLTLGKVAYVPGVFNLHRRHAGSVTIGGAAEAHFEEVRVAQQRARELFSVSQEGREKADAYLDVLRLHFKLPLRHPLES